MRNKNNLARLSGTLLLALSAVLAAGCSADGEDGLNGTGPGTGLDTGNGDTDGNGTLDPNEFPNDGSVPTDVTDNGTVIDGRFICTTSASGTGVTTTIGSNGLVGGPLTTLLNLLGADTATQLLNSVTEKDLLIDGKLSTHSTFSLTVGLLGSLLETVDQSVKLPAAVAAGQYAVFAISLPTGTVDLSLLNQISVTTARNGIVQETRTYTQNDLDLLGLGDQERAFIGLKATKSYDTATVRLTPGLLSANVGEAMYVHELCTGGRFIPVPTP